MRFVLMMQATEKDWSSFGAMPLEDIRRHVAFMKQVDAELRASGELVIDEGLAGPAEAKVIRAQQTGAALVRGAPFPEGKEFLTGFWLIDCEHERRAHEIAAQVSLAPGRNGAPMYIPVEVRQLMRAPGEEM